MNFQNDETNGHVCDTHRINHTKVIVVIPKRTQRIDLTIHHDEWAQPCTGHLKWLPFNPCSTSPVPSLPGLQL